MLACFESKWDVMSKFVVLMICLFQLSFVHAQYGEWVPANVTMKYQGVPHQILYKDLILNIDFESCLSYCRAIGYVNADYCGNYRLGTGPYVELNQMGHITQALPAQGNQNRFWVLAGGSYCSLPYQK